MNYASAFLGLIFLAAFIYWIVAGRKFYTGPRIQMEYVEGESQDLQDEPIEESEKSDEKMVR